MRPVFLRLLSVLVMASPVGAQLPAEPTVKLAEVVVTPSRFGVAETAVAAAATLTAAQLEVLPQIGDDLFRSIARLPGLAADDVSAQFWIRGAPHSELLARLDGVDLIEPFHLKDVDGAISIIDPATIRMIDLTTGGFTVEYGGRLAGVLTMETKSAVRPLTALNLSLTGLGVTNQGLWGQDRGRWLVGARRGYPDIALKMAGRDDEIAPRYYDLTLKLEYDVTPTQTVSLHALHAGDALRYRRTNDPSLSSGYDSDYVWGRWRGTRGDRLRGEAVVSWARLTWSRDGSGRLDGFPFSLRDHRRLDVLTLRNDWTLAWNEHLVFQGGVAASTADSRYDYALSHQRTIVIGSAQTVVTDNVNAALRPEQDTAGAFVTTKLRPIMSLVVEPGVRFDHHDLKNGNEVSPRLNAAWNVGRATLRSAWGKYSQSQGLHELNIADGEREFQRDEHAEHRVLGIEHPLPGASLRVEAYERISTRLRPRWDNLDNAYDLFPEAQPDRVRLNPERGRARGVELLLSSRGTPALQWHASYTWSHAEERIAGRWIPRARDQRHAVYADATYTLNPRWQFSAAWHFHSGWPTTDVLYSLAPLANGRRVLVSANGDVYGLRLPDYHRLDLRATRRFKTKHGELRAYLDVFNAYDRTNLLGYDHRVTISGTQVSDVKKPREQLPLLPSVGISWEF